MARVRVILLCIVGELTIFLGVTSTVHRKRPTRAAPRPGAADVELPVRSHRRRGRALRRAGRDAADRHAGQPTSSRPSSSPRRLLCVVPLIVATSRVYRGMHFATDVTAGALAGGLWMVIVIRTLLGQRAERRQRHRGGRHDPDAQSEAVADRPGALAAARATSRPWPCRSGVARCCSGWRCVTGRPASTRWLHDLVDPPPRRPPRAGADPDPGRLDPDRLAGRDRGVPAVPAFPRLASGRDHAGLRRRGRAGHRRTALAERLVRPARARRWPTGPARLADIAYPSGHTSAATIGAGALGWALVRHLDRRWARIAVWVGGRGSMPAWSAGPGSGSACTGRSTLLAAGCSAPAGCRGMAAGASGVERRFSPCALMSADRTAGSSAARPRTDAPVRRRHDRHVWVETDRPTVVEVLGHREPTFAVLGHHYALVLIEGLEPATTTPYDVRLDGHPVWPPDDGRPPPAIRTREGERQSRLVFGSCRVAAPAEPPYTLLPAEHPQGRRHRRAVGLRQGAAGRAGRVAGRPGPDRRPGLRRRRLAGDRAVHPQPPRRVEAPGRGRSRTSRSTPGSIASPGPTRRSAGCSRPCRRR